MVSLLRPGSSCAVNMSRSERTALFGSLLVPLVVVTAVSGEAVWWLASLLALLPLALVTMVVRILRDPGPVPPDLPPGDEWGYADRPDLRPRK